MTKFAIRYPGGTLVVIWMALIVTMWMMPDLRPDPIGVLPKSRWTPRACRPSCPEVAPSI